MRKLLLLLGVLAAIPLVLFLSRDTQTRTLANSLLTDVTAAKHRVIKREPPPKEPRHENGFKCLAGMLDVTSPALLAPFSGKSVEPLEPFITGAKPIAELPPEVRGSMASFSTWASSMRECSQSMQLAWVEGLAPWSPPSGPRLTRLAEAMPALIDFTALELKVLVADGQPEVALERCSTTLALAADQSHLGIAGAKTARLAVKRLAPGCNEALRALPAAATPVKSELGRQWTALQQRLAPVSEVIEAERIGVSVNRFAWVSDEVIRKQLDPLPRPEGDKAATARAWRSFDEAMRALGAASGAERQQASERVDAVLPSHYGASLGEYEQARAELDGLAAAAAQ